MKGRLAAFGGVFCIALLIVSGAYAGKPPKPDKPGKPPRPGNIAIECIEFTGDLESVPLGGTVVEGCCPNAGPSPAYTMTLRIGGEMPQEAWEVTFDGYLFAKPFRTRENRQWIRQYIIHFGTWDWDTEIPGTGDYFFEIFADEEDIEIEENTDVLTVEVESAPATVWVLHNVNKDCDPSIYPYCDDPCADNMEPACDPFIYDNCYHPCNEEIEVHVTFDMLKTTDLSYCE